MARMTQAEFLAYELRRQNPGTVGGTTGTSGCADESELHEQILAECRRRGWIALHGSMARPTRRTEGEPDFVLLVGETAVQYPRVLFVECKSRTGKLSPAQQAFAAHAKKLGHTIHVVRSFEDFLKLL